MDDSTEQTSEPDPAGAADAGAADAADAVDSARRGAFSNELDSSVMPPTGVFPVVQRRDVDATGTTADQTSEHARGTMPREDFPTEQHRPASNADGLPILGGHDPSVRAAFGAAPLAQGSVQRGQLPQGPAGPTGPGGPLVPPGRPAYAGPPRRHPAEIPLLVLVILVTVGIYAGAAALTLIGTLDPYFLLLLALPLLLWFARGTLWAQPRVQGIQMTPTQFPDGYRMVREAAERYGLREVPDAFVILGNGQINAFASGHGFRRFVVVYSDLFEVGGTARDPEALSYIIGHEVGHIAAGHVSYWRQVGSFAMSYIPVIGPALSRSQEYTADNYGYFNQPAGVPGGMGVLGAGKYLGREVDFDQLADRASTERGFFTWLVNLVASHPVLTWRAAALRNRTRAGSLFFAPSTPVRGIGGGAVGPAHQVSTFNKQEILAPPPGSTTHPQQSVGHQPFGPGR